MNHEKYEGECKGEDQREGLTTEAPRAQRMEEEAGMQVRNDQAMQRCRRARGLALYHRGRPHQTQAPLPYCPTLKKH